MKHINPAAYIRLRQPLGEKLFRLRTLRKEIQEAFRCQLNVSDRVYRDLEAGKYRHPQILYKMQQFLLLPVTEREKFCLPMKPLSEKEILDSGLLEMIAEVIGTDAQQIDEPQFETRSIGGLLSMPGCEIAFDLLTDSLDTFTGNGISVTLKRLERPFLPASEVIDFLWEEL